jgi:hypothetical protein
MTEKSTIAGLISKASKKLRDEFEHIRETNSHNGEKGTEVQNVLKEFLNIQLPQRFRATSGFVIDIENQMSDHQDVIIYDAMSSAVFRYEKENQIVPSDAVAAIIEVKSVLNKAELEDAFSKIEEVKKLRKRPLGEMDQKPTASEMTTTATLGVEFGFETNTKLDTLAAHCAELNEKFRYRPSPRSNRHSECRRYKLRS